MQKQASLVRQFTLTELCESIESVISGAYKKSYWVKAEIVRLNYYPKSGHCYPDLVDKKEGRVQSQLRAMLWGRDYQRIQKKFKKDCGSDLKSGMNVLLLAKVNFHPVHGISLHIQDIDTNYTIGEMALNRKMTLKRLENEGLTKLNKMLTLSPIPKRIAVLSVETSKGFQDFKKVIDKSAYSIEIELFTVLLQGDKAVKSIGDQLKVVAQFTDHFDAVAIIRGGGGDIGLDCYDAYALAKQVALMPLPVFCGIGHAANLSVTELMAFRHFITPTELGYFIVHLFDNQLSKLKDIELNIAEASKNLISDSNRTLSDSVRLVQNLSKAIILKEHQDLVWMKKTFKSESKQLIYNQIKEVSFLKTNLSSESKSLFESEHNNLTLAQTTLKTSVKEKLNKQKNYLQHQNELVRLFDPKQLLERGYAWARKEGKLLKSVDQLKPEDELVVSLSDGEIKTKIIEIYGKKEA
ncbi:MAG: exodeoxyribonuclease VII large subunit [Flavobacteriales bacterium]